jgi:glycerol-3-phosphate acyltransferase PlsY
MDGEFSRIGGSQVTILVLLAFIVYLAASINFSILLFKFLGKGDPRDRFSGNAGTVNVIRQLGLFWGIVVLMLDMGRAGAVAILGAQFLPGPLVPLLGFVLVLGNQKPLIHRFRGGKGVASYLGFTFFITPLWAGVSCLAWIFAYMLFRRPFMGSFFMIATLGLGTMIHYAWSWVVVGNVSLTVALIYLAHKPNIIAYRGEFAKKC